MEIFTFSSCLFLPTNFSCSSSVSLIHSPAASCNNYKIEYISSLFFQIAISVDKRTHLSSKPFHCFPNFPCKLLVVVSFSPLPPPMPQSADSSHLHSIKFTNPQILQELVLSLHQVQNACIIDLVSPYINKISTEV